MEIFSAKVIAGVMSDPIIMFETAGLLLFAGYLIRELCSSSFLQSAFLQSSFLPASLLSNSLSVRRSSYDVEAGETIHFPAVALLSGASIPSASLYSRVPVMSRRTAVGVGGAISEPKSSLHSQAGRIHFEGTLRSRRFERLAISA